MTRLNIVLDPPCHHHQNPEKKSVPHLEDLPEHLMADILSRLPVKTIIHCKCVCKKWLDLISDSYFADLQLSRSPAGLMIYHIFERERTVGILRWTEVEDELDHYPVMSVDLDFSPIFQNTQIYPLPSVNGLLCLRHFEKTYICNPITREYMVLPRPQYYTLGSARGFGVSSLTREYKVVRIFQAPDSTSTSQPSLLEAEVYTIGTGQWRSVGHAPRLSHSYAPIFLNGHAHWIVIDEDSPEKLCAFDFDKETFKLFPSPPSEAIDEYRFHKTLGILKGCLCQCDSDEFKLTVWVMKEYGIKKSWHKELVMEKNISIGVDLEALEIVYILDGLTDGTILMASYQDTLFVYCPQRKTIVDREIFGYCLKVQAYRPSFHRLKSFEKERVHVF